jgi:hypothetical protein
MGRDTGDVAQGNLGDRPGWAPSPINQRKTKLDAGKLSFRNEVECFLKNDQSHQSLCLLVECVR